MKMSDEFRIGVSTRRRKTLAVPYPDGIRLQSCPLLTTLVSDLMPSSDDRPHRALGVHLRIASQTRSCGGAAVRRAAVHRRTTPGPLRGARTANAAL